MKPDAGFVMNHLWVWHVIRAGILRQTFEIANATDAFLPVSRGFPRFQSRQRHHEGDTAFFPAGFFLFAGRKVT
ncbi:hypothetical protein AGI99_000730 [Cronobacter sakazakii]|nr:hypothetical protein [Cronobacter sakazakii]